MIKLQATLNDDYSYISPLDDALDTDAEDFEDQWKRYEDGQGEPPLKQGCKPTIWTLSPIVDATLRAKLTDVVSADGSRTAAVAWAAHALKSVSGLTDADGKPYRLRFTVDADGYRSVAREQLNEIGLPVLLDMGLHAAKHSSPS